jgi:hypothetical protein
VSTVEEGIDHVTAADVRSRAAQVGEYAGVVTASLFKGVGEDSEALAVEDAGR